MDILKIDSLDAGYGTKTILHDINLVVSPGQFISVIAPNGTGKTTLLKAIAGILLPFKGDIRFKDRALSGYGRRELAKRIAVVGSETAAFDYTAEEMVLMGRFAHIPRFSGPTAQDRSIVRTAMEDVGIWHKESYPCSQLSQGERQKVIIARALAQEPELLLLDEPTAHLDICNQFSILHLVKNLASQKNIAVIAVLHDINLALEFSTHLLLLKDGRILDYGQTYDVLNPAALKELYGMEFTLHRDVAATFVRPTLA
jgi:iron complex transport system ATP-binding protein